MTDRTERRISDRDAVRVPRGLTASVRLWCKAVDKMVQLDPEQLPEGVQRQIDHASKYLALTHQTWINNGRTGQDEAPAALVDAVGDMFDVIGSDYPLVASGEMLRPELRQSFTAAVARLRTAAQSIVPMDPEIWGPPGAPDQPLGDGDGR